jgi:predicted permease
MDSIILLLLCMLIGFGLKFVKTFPKNGYLALNQFIIYVALPALTLYYIPKIKIDSTLFFPIGIAWIGFLLSFVFFYSLGKKLGWSNKLIGCLILTAGLGNTSFVGFPIIQALYGDEGLKTAIIVDQPGSFTVLTTLGIITASFFSKGKPDFKFILSKMAYFPPFIAFVFAGIMNLFHFDFAEIVQAVFQKLGAAITPIAMISVGLQLSIDRKSQHWGFLGLGLFFKLLITPAFFYLFYKTVLNGKGLSVDVSILESAMAPMITGSILASTYGLKPKLSSMMLSVGIPVSFITVLFWHWILSTF